MDSTLKGSDRLTLAYGAMATLDGACCALLNRLGVSLRSKPHD